MHDAGSARELLGWLERYLVELEEMIPSHAAVLVEKVKDLRAAERALQIAIQACLDLGRQVILMAGLPTPRSYRDAITVLADAGLVSRKLALEMQDAAALRNLLVHGYTRVDPARLYSSLKATPSRLRRFARSMARFLASYGEEHSPRRRRS